MSRVGSKIGACVTVEEATARRPAARPALLRLGLHCVGCAFARFDTIADAARNHGVPLRRILDALETSEPSPIRRRPRRRRR